MNTVTCACLVDFQDDAILVVRVRENDKWYLAGGKIDFGETPEEALCRELSEELGISLDPINLRYRNTVEGPAYGRAGLVRLVCFESTIEFEPIPHSEISEVAWLGEQRFDDLAPAVQILYRQWQSGSF